MSFQPRMQNRISGFKVLGGLHRREWNGIVADVWDVECETQAGGHYVSDDPRMFIVLEAQGGARCNVKLSPDSRGSVQNDHRQALSYIPAGMEIWADVVDVSYIRHLDLHFNLEILSRRLMEDLDADRYDTPRLMFHDERFLQLAQLIAAECLNPQPLHDLYGDGLTVALFIDLMKLNRSDARKRSPLATWQLRRAVEFIDENSSRNIRLEELASLAGLSQSHFSHAFKASTGMAPHQWQTNARVEKAKTLLLKNEVSLTAIAAETGFSDQAHFTRIFRRVVGTTPALWKRSRLS
ncbi:MULTISPECIES: AraC family transcriptional regulator [unclassified Ensifer]|uniref:helix-turn-helix domain-containing protein n=1 Tax=unclassified Ensifer TaxID=2633371 RepID=UPI0008135FB5|nr:MULTISPECIES: AraC family transcriptional regulator [unclassified Ensifer]OCP00610.1 AraC family transcriptional regulator [Ensifer sp. LC14]OCP07836.1 AraC family transcriptional regulator [Ensifer sp. LC11]OCP08604.1 AraC family transcriptional regulator [Ensifer sp. LC13]OCP32104.1 AraC family transcriptional regulator [Ensifer sp. LC499]